LEVGVRRRVNPPFSRQIGPDNITRQLRCFPKRTATISQAYSATKGVCPICPFCEAWCVDFDEEMDDFGQKEKEKGLLAWWRHLIFKLWRRVPLKPVPANAAIRVPLETLLHLWFVW